MTCTDCGEQIQPLDAYCGNCGTAAPRSGGEIILERSPAERPASVQPGLEYGQFPAPSMAPSPSPSHRQPASRPSGPPDGDASRQQVPRFALAHDERVLKAYDAVEFCPGLFRRKRGEGTLYVTDARLVFYAWVYPRATQRASWVLQQTKLEDISGLAASVSRRISLGLVVLTLVFGFLTLSTLFTLLLPLTFIFAILTAVCVIFLVVDANRRGSVAVEINSRENDNSPIRFGHGARTGFLESLMLMLMFPVRIFVRNYTAADVLNGDPARDADVLVHELGALILDLQSRGSHAYAHWGIPASAAGTSAAAVQ